ncbi:MAG: DUF4118 domain-containing protein [Pseudoflavonifractor sp.]|nr:DUF4118 domain-containing protein [Pseudoflavonifractor sp.]
MGTLLGRGRSVLRALPSVLRDLAITVLLMAGASFGSAFLLRHTGVENNTALVYVMAVVLISRLTSGYFYAVAASLVGGFCTNYYFMYPYASFSLEFAGYPVAMLSMVAISLVVCTLTTQLKNQAEEAVQRERNTKALYELNERLGQEKATIQLEKDRETIRSNILRAVSHDLRTPLTSISGAAAVLLESGNRDQRDEMLLSDIKSDADALITMVENLLSVTRIQGETQLKKQSEVLEEVAGDAVMKVRRRFPEAEVKLQLSDDILLVPMAPMLIQQVICNLLENAVRHSGDPTGIVLRLYRRGEMAVTEVTDRGRGLTPEVLEAVRAGRPLSTSTSGDSTRGMGIGLSVCQSIIAAHGGTLEAENSPSGGAIFRFDLPLKEEGDSEWTQP